MKNIGRVQEIMRASADTAINLDRALWRSVDTHEIHDKLLDLVFSYSSDLKAEKQAFRVWVRGNRKYCYLLADYDENLGHEFRLYEKSE